MRFELFEKKYSGRKPVRKSQIEVGQDCYLDWEQNCHATAIAAVSLVPGVLGRAKLRPVFEPA
jgi:hypothetical protein